MWRRYHGTVNSALKNIGAAGLGDAPLQRCGEGVRINGHVQRIANFSKG